MAPTSPPQLELSGDAKRLLQFVKYNEPAGPFGCALLTVLYFVTGELLVWLLVAAVAANWALVVHARHLLHRNVVEQAVLAISAGMWLISLGLWWTVPMAQSLAVIINVMPIVLAAAYIRRQYALAIAAVSVGVAAVGAAYYVFEPWAPVQGVPDWILLPVVGFFLPALTASCALAVWHSIARLLEALDQMRAANVALADSERLLEQKVEERTADLTRSQRDLALARDEALAANRTKSTFLASMSHELRTPLNAIIGYTEMLQEDSRDAGHDDYGPDLQKILSSGKHLLGLINDVLDLSKIEAGKVDLFAESFDVAELVQGVAVTVQPLVENNANQLEIGQLDGAGTMHSDATRIRQILLNLLSNASKFTNEGTIHLGAERRISEVGERICFSVADSGIGMSGEQMSRIFDAFSQADASTTRDYGGTGLGLAITKRFCEMLGGEVTVTSTVGQGTEFRVDLPVEMPEPTSADEVRPTDESSGGVAIEATQGRSRILVIDDEENARELMRRILTREGYAVATAAGGEEGLRLARELHPDVITLDVLMPETDGWTVLSTLQADQELADIPVILVTMLDEQNLGYTLGASEYLSKPVDRERLAGLLRRYAKPDARGPVLVVDDHAETRQLLRRTIEKAGLRVVEAGDGREALSQVEAAAPVLILLDLMMPVMDGFEFLSELREKEDWRSIPVVVVTAKDLSPDERQRLDAAAERVLQKGSYTREGLLAQVRQLVETRADG